MVMPNKNDPISNRVDLIRIAILQLARRWWQANANLSPLPGPSGLESGDDVKPISFKRHRFPAAVILQAVRLYFRFTRVSATSRN